MDSRQELLAQLKQPPTRPHLTAVPEFVLRHSSQRNNETVSFGFFVYFRRSLFCWAIVCIVLARSQRSETSNVPREHIQTDRVHPDVSARTTS